MAGAMRRMGIYLGLVEDDERAGYDRYAARQTGYDDEPAYGRYAGDRGYDEYERDYPEVEQYSEPLPVEHPRAEREPVSAHRSEREPVSAHRSERELSGARRPAGAGLGSVRPIGLAGQAPTTGSTSVRMSSSLSGAGAAGLAVKEPVHAPAPPVLAPVPDPAPAAGPTPTPYRITTLHPRTYNEARTIGERFRDGSPVIMNLTEMDDADAKRLVDFAAGLSFGLRGSIERVTAKLFLISPQNIDVTAEDKARIREGGFFNQS